MMESIASMAMGMSRGTVSGTVFHGRAKEGHGDSGACGAGDASDAAVGPWNGAVY